MSYTNTSYKPTKDDLVCLFRIEPAKGLSIKKVSESIAAESSIGTWTDISTMSPEIRDTLQPHVFEFFDATDNSPMPDINSQKPAKVKIAYPSALFEEGNMPCILSSIAGNIFGMKDVARLRLLDISFPKSLVKSFRGPQFGIAGVRKITGVKDRPLVGTIIKPKLGLPSKEHARVAYEAWVGGLDIVKDDENLTSQKFNPFKERIAKTLKMCDKAEAETGETKIYMPNVTAETSEMLKRAELVKESGGRYVMVDIVTCGFSGLQSLREKTQELGLAVHAHRAMYAAFARDKTHGMTMLALAKIMRLIGADQLHTGTVIGKMEGDQKLVTSIRDEIVKDSVAENFETDMLAQDWYGLKTVFPVSSGGLHPGHVPELVRMLGRDLIIQAGGGVHGHPGGTTLGAKAMRQAVDAAMNGVPLGEYAKTHEELKKALEKWPL